MALSSAMNSLLSSGLGLTLSQLTQLKEWNSRSVGVSLSLRLKSTESCSFIRETKRDVDSATKHVTEGLGSKIVSKSVTTITEYYWKFQVEYELIAYRGTILSIFQKSRQTTIMITTNQIPRPEIVIRDPIDMNITYFFALFQFQSQTESQPYPDFKINRRSSICYTPRRNSDVQELLSFFHNLFSWCGEVQSYFLNTIFSIEKDQRLDLSSINRLRDVFVPVVPLMNGNKNVISMNRLRESVEPNESEEESVIQISHIVLSISEANQFLDEEKRTLEAKYSQLRSSFPSSDTGLITSTEACLLATTYHIQEICQHYKDGVDYVEDMLRSQLVSAIGKVVKPQDFSDYMRFHNQKIFLPKYQPKAFCYAIRRSSSHAPEGVLSIEEYPSDGSIAEPIYTLANSSVSRNRMEFTVNAGNHRAK
jgi:hypothetical protein